MTALELIKIAQCVQINSEAFKFSQGLIENHFIEKHLKKILRAKLSIIIVWFPNDKK